MRIGYLISQYPAINHTFILREIRFLRSAGFDIHAVSVRPPDRPVSEMTEEEADEARQSQSILSLGAGSIAAILIGEFLRRPAGFLRGLGAAIRLGGLRPLVYFAEAVVAGRWFLARDLTHVHSHFTSTVASLIAEIYPITISLTLHGPVEFAEPRAFRLQEKIEASRFTVAISRFGAAQMMLAVAPEHWSRIETVYLGVDPGVFTPATFSEDIPVLRLLTVGRLAPVKGQHVMLEAIALLRARGIAVHLRIAGDGPDRPSLERRAAVLKISDAVSFEGWVGQDTIRSLYGACDVYVMSSFAEGIPVVLMEAMAMCVPSVSTWVNGVPELIESGIDGLLCAPGDASGLAECLARLAADSELRRNLGEAGRRKVMRKFDIASNGAALARIFQNRLG